MTTLTLDLQDDSAIQRGITLLQRMLGNGPTAAQAPAGAAGQRTATTGAARGQTAGAPSPTAAPAAAQQQASTAATEAGNAAAAGPNAAATPASSTTPAASPAVSFDELKKAFLGLSTKAGGRGLCEGVLKPFGLAKLSEAKVEQYADIKAAIDKAAA